MTNLIVTVIIGLLGGYTALRFKVPAGAMVGSMLATAIFNIITGDAFLPQNVRIVTQIAAGAFIGSGITYRDVLDIRHMFKPAILMVVSMIVLDLGMGYIMYRATGIDLITSLFATAPGGIVDMSLISSDLGADTSKVAILHMVRLISVLTIFPTMMKFISLKLEGKETKEEFRRGGKAKNADKNTENVVAASKVEKSLKEGATNLAITLGASLIAGFMGYYTGIPAGAMTFAMVAAGAVNIFFKRGYMPLNLRRVTQVFAGILIGERMTFSDVIALKGAIVPALMLIFGLIIVNLCIGILINRICKLELITSLLASAPGGMSDMALIAKDLGGDGPKVAILQLTRYVSTIAIFPILIKFISKLL